MKFILSFFISALFLCSCKPKYQPALSYYSEGFRETRLGRNIFKITYNGGLFAGIEEAVDFCLLRCADTTLLRGFDYFRITKENSGIYQYLVKNDDLTGTIGGYPVVISGGYSEGIPKAVASNTIVCTHEVPPHASEFMNARQIRSIIIKKYSK